MLQLFEVESTRNLTNSQMKSSCSVCWSDKYQTPTADMSSVQINICHQPRRPHILTKKINNKKFITESLRRGIIIKKNIKYNIPTYQWGSTSLKKLSEIVKICSITKLC